MKCPKCHQPLEDADEVYICCAGESLRWRCTACAKVSEGFAFPHGSCPACGGKLEPLAPRDIDDAALNAVRTAFEIELGGEAFYRRAAEDSTDPLLSDLFARLAAMEREHMSTLSRRYHTEVGVPSPALRIDLAAVYAGVDHRPEDPTNLFRIAIALERRAARFFGERADEAPAQSVERQLYKELAAEEQEHATLLMTEFARWDRGKAGLLGA